jgi:two-component system, LytTR family, sensor kinase
MMKFNIQPNKVFFYWLAQFLGWLTYIFLALIQLKLNNNPLNTKLLIILFFVFIGGVFFSHLYKKIIIRLGWLDAGIGKITLRIMIGALALGMVFEGYYFVVKSLVNWHFEFNIFNLLQESLSWIFLFFTWSLIYFTYHFFENFRKQEILNLTWIAKQNEIELQQLKSQLNPHFFFNSMNSIKALIDENPEKARQNINKLSNLLRSTLQLGKKELIKFQDEMSLVDDYLDLEKTRFEEKLTIQLNVSPLCYSVMVPPMLIQTLVENAIKHGISTLPKGGLLKLDAELKEGFLNIEIYNDGIYNQMNKSKGLGINNTTQRLNLIFQKKALFCINNVENGVLVKIKIPNS